MNGNASQNSALSAGLAGRSERLPSAEEFSFSAILRAVDPEIRDAIDAIAEICARSRLSLADEYDAHLPPQGEITGDRPGWAMGAGALAGRSRISRIGQGWPVSENTLTAVPEASSSSERLAGSVSGPSQKRRSQSAYGSLKSVISGGSDKRRSPIPQMEASGSAATQTQAQAAVPQAVKASSSTPAPPSITLITTPQASKHLSLDLSSTITDVHSTPQDPPSAAPDSQLPQQISHRRNTSTASIPTRTRSSTLSSLASWIPWSRADADDATKAETKLREMLSLSQSSGPSLGKGKAALSSAA